MDNGKEGRGAPARLKPDLTNSALAENTTARTIPLSFNFVSLCCFHLDCAKRRTRLMA